MLSEKNQIDECKLEPVNSIIMLSLTTKNAITPW